ALLSSLGAAISTSRWIKWGTRNIYPNIWVMLVGSSTLVRKTTSLNTGLYFNLLFDSEHPDRNYKLPEDGSLAALLGVLGREKQGVLRHSEVATLLTMMSKGYNVNMKSTFTDFFDVPPTYKIQLKGEGDILLERPIFSMATATTPLWLKKNLSYGDLESGFPARFLYCFKDKKDISIAIPKTPEETMMREYNQVFAALYSLKPREITLSPSYEEKYTSFYNEIESLYENPLLDDGTKSLIGRLQTDYFIKLTILECVLTNTLEATAVEAERVCYLLRFYIAQANTIMRIILKTERTKHEDKVLEFLRIKGKAGQTDLYHLFSNNIHASDLKSTMKTLEDALLVRKNGTGRNVFYELFTPSSL
ncbi:MAG: DUF3987 domain-containing protein, partial [Sphaerochaetaceae bacterium]|nr:DUF3987 domain-containing protein [Sphaerochaetaceae bacterium]